MSLVQTESPKSSTRILAKILIIDDEESIGIGVSDLLNSYEYSADYVMSAEAGVKYLESNPDVDIVLLDINLGTGMSGLEALPVIKDRFRYVQIIMLTSHDSIEVGIKAMKNGAHDYLTKPFDERNFFELVPQALEKKKLTQLSDLYLGILVHDMNNPLNNISLGMDMLKITLKENLNPRQERLFGVVHSGLWEIKNMVRNILNVNKFEQGGVAARITEFELRPCLEKTLSIFSGLIQITEKKIKTEFLLPENSKIHADKELLNQVIGNLLSNSLRYCPKNEEVEFKVQYSEPKLLKFSVTNPGSFVPDSMKNEIFNKFFIGQAQEKGKSNRNFGLGLSYSKMAVEAMNGHIWVESQESPEITTFHFTIPQS